MSLDLNPRHLKIICAVVCIHWLFIYFKIINAYFHSVAFSVCKILGNSVKSFVTYMLFTFFACFTSKNSWNSSLTYLYISSILLPLFIEVFTLLYIFWCYFVLLHLNILLFSHALDCHTLKSLLLAYVTDGLSRLYCDNRDSYILSTYNDTHFEGRIYYFCQVYKISR